MAGHLKDDTTLAAIALMAQLVPPDPGGWA